MTEMIQQSNRLQGFSPAERDQFERDGFVVARRLVDLETVAELRAIALEHEQLRTAPLEYEADVRYPGAPPTRSSPGGDTPRRLLQAYHRHDRFKAWAHDPRLVERLQQLLGRQALWLTQSHHNCIMTKCPAYSSDTGWHQDVRYWSFSNRNLVNTWLALGDEFPANGGLRVIPGSQHWHGLGERLDSQSFLRPEHPANQQAMNDAIDLGLQPGDVLFFHAAVFHSASRNHTDDNKYSVVFTYHDSDTEPESDSKSTGYPEIQI